MSLLEVKNLKTVFNTPYGKVKAVNDVSFSINEGEVVGIVGESGSGKSVTSLSIMNLISKPNGIIENGQIIFEGMDLLKLSDKEMCKVRGNNISMVFQEPMTSLNPVFTIENQIGEVLKLHKNCNKQDIHERVIKVLKDLKIPNPQEVMKKYPFELSGGMRQRIVIAMAIVCTPKIIIADEPTTALDVTTQDEILCLLKNITESINSSVMLITHDLGVIAEMATKVIVMYRGKIVEQCDVVEFFDNAKHPYSQGLINSMPNNFTKNGRFHCIKGNVPSMHEEIKGCAFCESCYRAMKICKEKEPPIKKIRQGHTVSCWLEQEV